VAGHREDPSDRSAVDHARRRARRLTAKVALAFCFVALVALVAYLPRVISEQELAEPISNPGSPFLPGDREPNSLDPRHFERNSAEPRRSEPNPANPGDRVSPFLPNPADPELDAFIRFCEEARFRPAQVDYPRTLSARMGQATTYGAAVDIRGTPAPPGKVIDADDPTSDPVYVECVVAARLVSVGGGIDVDSADATEGGWRYRSFTPSGVLEWSWSVTPRRPVSQQLRLELKPAARARDLIPGSNIITTADYVTTVNVSATRIDRLAYWFQTQWVLLSGVAGTVGVAVLAILAFSAKARDAVKGLFARKSGARTRKRATAAASSTKTPTTKTKTSTTKPKQTAKSSKKTGSGPN
jgi:hypothetical protein